MRSLTPNPQPLTTVSRASVRAWLQSRQPPPPATLATKLAELLDAAPDSALGGDSMASVMGALGFFALHSRLGAPDSAMDLLAADAFVTYAFEAASEGGRDVTGLAHELLAEVRT